MRLRNNAILGIAAIALFAFFIAAGPHDQTPTVRAVGEWQFLGEPDRAGPTAGDIENSVFVPPAGLEDGTLRMAQLGTPTKFQVSFHKDVPEQARIAFNYAASIWEQYLETSVPITVDVGWKSLGGSTLGLGGPNNVLRNTGTGRVYPIALANKLAGTDLDPAKTDMTTEYNKAAKWYFGLDGKVPKGQYDFVTVVLHELGHGIGFMGGLKFSGGKGGYDAKLGLFLCDALIGLQDGSTLVDRYPNNSPDMGKALTGGALYFTGPSVTAANAGVPAKLYAPKTWKQGSSVYHWDEGTISQENALMSPQGAPGEAIHNPGPLLVGLFRDLGWGNTAPPVVFSGNVAGGPQPGDPVVVLVDDGSGTVTVCGTASLVSNTYRVTVTGEAKAGCGRQGATVRFYFPATRQYGPDPVAWPEAGFTLTHHITVPAPLKNQRNSPDVKRN